MTAASLLTALFNGAWQGALLCAAALVILRGFRRLNATTMFVVWNVLLAIAVALPIANLVFAPKPYTVVVKPVAALDEQRSVRYTAPADSWGRLIPAPRVRITQRVTMDVPQPSIAERVVALGRLAPSNAYAVLVVLATIALLRLLVLLRDLVRMFIVRHSVRLIEAPVHLHDSIRRPFLFAASRDMRSPCVIGFSPALIVIPEDLLGEPAPVLKSIVLHEREHVRRFDDIQNLLQRIVGAVAFFLPGAVIALRELALYREKICDDAALNGTGDAVSYAMTLTGMAQWAVGRGTPMPTLIFKRRHLLHRMEVLLDSAVSHSPQTNRRFALSAALALALAAAIVLRFQVPVIAQTIAPLAAARATVAHARVTIAAGHESATQHVAKPEPTASPAAKHAAPAHPKPQATPHSVKHTTHSSSEPRRSFFALPATARSSRGARPMHVAYAYAYNYATADSTIETVRPAVAPPVIPPVHMHAHLASRLASDDLLDALRAQNMQNLTVDQLIALRDHGVSGLLVRSAASYFGHLGAQDLVYLADHGVGPSYIETLRASGINGISPADATQLMDHGVTSRLIAAAFAYYNPRPSAADLSYLADHGITQGCIESFRSAGLQVEIVDTVRLRDHGVDGDFVRRVRAFNPRASIDDIIRLRDSGF